MITHMTSAYWRVSRFPDCIGQGADYSEGATERIVQSGLSVSQKSKENLPVLVLNKTMLVCSESGKYLGEIVVRYMTWTK